MKISFHAGAALALLAALAADAPAETRMQVSAGSTSIRTQPAADAPAVGRATAGEVLFVERVEGDWAAVSPPDRIDLWLNKDFIEGNRVVAKSIQLRSGPGVQHPVVGVLERGAPVMPRGEDGDWCRVAAPSSAILWVKKSDLAEVRTRSEPIQQVAAVPEPAKPAPPPPAPTPPPAPKPEPIAQPVEVAVAAPAPVPAPAPAPAQAPAPGPQSPPRVAPSRPQADLPPTPKPASAPEPAPFAPTAAPARPVAPPVQVAARPPAATPPSPVAAPPPAPAATTRPAAAPRPPAAPVLRPATALPAQPQPAPAGRPAAQVAPAPPPAPAAAQPKPRRIEVEVDSDLVDDLDLEDLPNQGKTVQVEGELRNAPFMAGSPSRYRLQARDENGVLEMICHVHGHADQLRPFVGKTIAIRGREYWVEDSDMPVVVVGQIKSLAPVADEDEPVMF